MALRPDNLHLRCENDPMSVVPYVRAPSLCAIALLGMLVACAAPAPQATTAARPIASVAEVAAAANVDAGTVPPGYLVGVGDEIDVKFDNHPDMNESVKVRPDGRITLQFVGTLETAGHGPDELEKTIAQRYAALSSDAIAPRDKQYILGPDDEIEVNFAYMPSFNQTMRVRPDGKLSLMLVKTVEVQGKSPEQLQEELTTRYRAFLRNPELIVILRSYSRTRVVSNGQRLLSGLADLRPTVIVRSVAPTQIYVGGEVLRPGVIAYQPPVTLLQAIIQAGGYRPSAEMRSVVVLRKAANGKPLLIRRNLRSDLDGGETNDIYLAAYDVVIVPKTPVAATAEAIDQYVWQVMPPLKNTSLGFIYQLNTNFTTTTRRQ